MIQDVIEPFLKAGLCTHIYASVGVLSEAEPRLVYEHYPDDNNIFDLASLTKAFVATPLVFQLLVQKKIPSLQTTLGELLSEHWPRGLHVNFKNVSLIELLRHESGLPAWRNFWICKLGVDTQEELQDPIKRRQHMIEVLNRCADAVVSSEKKQTYSDVGFILLGLVLEVFFSKSLNQQFRDFCSQELSLGKSLALAYACDLEKNRSQTIPTSYCALRLRPLKGEVHDENCGSLGGVSAHAGLFGSGESVSKYLVALGGSKTGLELIRANHLAVSPVAAEKPNTEPIKGPIPESLIGWRQGADSGARGFAAGLAMGHLGFTGTAFWLDPTSRTYAVLLTNRVISGRTRMQGASEEQQMQYGMTACRREVFTFLWQQIHKLST